MLSAQQMQSLPDFFSDIPDPRRAQGRRHRLSTVLAIAAGATLCGMRGYLAISDWAKSLGQKARKCFGCRYQNNRYRIPSLSVIRDVLIRVGPVHLNRAIQRWNQVYGQEDPDFVHYDTPDHGRIEIHKIWTTTELNDYLNFPHAGQAFVIQREFTDKKSGEYSCEIAYGITSRTPEQADAQCVLATNRGHWCIENSCHYIIDWNYDEDRSRIRTGHGPENMARLRRFAISCIKLKGVTNIAQKMRHLARNVRLVFVYLRITENSCAGAL